MLSALMPSIGHLVMSVPAPTIHWTPPKYIVDTGRNISLFIIIGWILFYVKKVVAPGEHRGLGGRGEGGKILLAACALLVLLNLSALDTDANDIIKVIWDFGEAIHFPGIS